MEINKRKSVYCPLKDLKYSWNPTDSDYIEVTQWTSGEGWDITIYHNKQERHISLSYEDLDIINYLVKHLDYND